MNRKEQLHRIDEILESVPDISPELRSIMEHAKSPVYQNKLDRIARARRRSGLRWAAIALPIGAVFGVLFSLLMGIAETGVIFQAVVLESAILALGGFFIGRQFFTEMDFERP